jgi:hypothetical protein
VRVDLVHAAALVHLAAGIGGLELDPHDCSVMKWPAALTRNGDLQLANLANARIAPCCRYGLAALFLFAWPRLRDLLL